MTEQVAPPFQAPSAERATYFGNCHCGSVAYEATLSPMFPKHTVVLCNCSVCHKNGSLLVYSSKDNVKWRRGFDQLKEYRFGANKNVHLFCGICGSSVAVDITARMKDQGIGPTYALNVRMFKDVDQEKLEYKRVDGWSKLDPPYHVD